MEVYQRKESGDYVLVESLSGFYETKVYEGADLLFIFNSHGDWSYSGFHALITSLEGKNTHE